MSFVEEQYLMRLRMFPYPQVEKLCAPPHACPYLALYGLLFAHPMFSLYIPDKDKSPTQYSWEQEMFGAILEDNRFEKTTI